MIKEEFLKITRITEDQFYGRESIEGHLDLYGITSIPEGFNPTVGGGLYLDNLTSIPPTFNPTVGGSLYLDSLTSIPSTFNPTVGGDLYLSSLTSIPPTFNPTVGGSLNLPNIKYIPEGFNPTVGGNLYLRSLTSIPEGFNPTVGGNLDLRSLTSIPEGFNPTVGGDLDLPNVKTIPDTFNPTVGGYLNLSNVKSIPSTFNLTVGSHLILNSLTSIPNNFNPTVGGGLWLPEHIEQPKYNKIDGHNYLFTWQNGRYVKADGVFSEVVHKRGDVYKLKDIGRDKTYYLVTDGTKYSHGKTIKEANEDLIYKITDRNKSYYKDYTLSSELSFEEAITCYRVITGACSFGTKDFVKNKLQTKQETYTIQEIMDITEGEYGSNTFKEYFK